MISLPSWLTAPFRKNWTESLHYFVIALGICISGIWALHTFDILNQKETALATLNKTNSELAKAKLELKELQDKITGTISSDITLDIEQMAFAKGKYGLIINVTVKNNGTQAVNMSWKETPLTVYKTKYKGDKIKSTKVLHPYIYRQFKSEGINQTTFIDKLLLFVGAQKTLSFFVELEEPGLYYIAFEAKVDKHLQQQLTKQGKSGIWLTSKYHFVADNNK